MAYNLQDVFMGTGGDLAISANGDIRLSNSFESVKQTVNFIAQTDKGGYVPDDRIGGDLGTYIGGSLTEDVLTSMERSLVQNLSTFILNRPDFKVHCIPISMDEIGVFIAIGGEYLEADGNILETSTEVVSFTFSYFDGNPSIN
jgi:hypothetical protein